MAQAYSNFGEEHAVRVRDDIQDDVPAVDDGFAGAGAHAVEGSEVRGVDAVLSRGEHAVHRHRPQQLARGERGGRRGGTPIAVAGPVDKAVLNPEGIGAHRQVQRADADHPDPHADVRRW